MQENTDTYYLGSRRMVSILPTTISFVYSMLLELNSLV
nr:MAG TPA: hypothetical protein [Caudoviricetes sp.]